MLTRRKAEQTFALERITPTQASKYLKDNTKNRSLSAKTVDRYAKAIKANKWVVNGVPIIFAPDGVLVDGQHRLSAIVQAKKAIQTYVVRNISNDVFHTIDNGKIRNGADVLSIHGCRKNIPVKAAALKIYNAMQNGGSTNDLDGYVVRLENYELLELYQKTPDIDQEIDSATKYTAAKRLLGYGAFGGTFYLFGRVDKEARDTFFVGLNDGADLPLHSPILALRNKIMLLKTQGNRLRTGEVVRLTIAAWRAFRTGRKVSHVRGKDRYYIGDIC